MLGGCLLSNAFRRSSSVAPDESMSDLAYSTSTRKYFYNMTFTSSMLIKYCDNHNLDDKKEIVSNDTLECASHQSNKTVKVKNNNDSCAMPRTISNKTH